MIAVAPGVAQEIAKARSGADKGPVRNTLGTSTSAARAIGATGINGTTIGHTASGSGSIGGPAKNLSGIDGTAMRPRR